MPRRHPTAAPDLPTVFFLHFLGGSAREWAPVIVSIGDAAHCAPLDLPGFGEHASETGHTVREMADRVADAVRTRSSGRWALVGHSMGAKVAAVLARRAEDGEAGLAGLSHLVTVAGSPPCPEPMDEDRRQTMLGWFRGDAAERTTQAAFFIDENSNTPLPPAVKAQAVDDVLRMDGAAWRDWLGQGSREDWADRVGVLTTPALVIAGAEDGDLGPAAQQRLMLPHFAAGRMVAVPAAKHLLPMETPVEIARLIVQHIAPATIPGAYCALIDSPRVASTTRAVLLARARPDDPAYAPMALSPEAFATLRAVVARVVPQDPASAIDLAARIDKALEDGAGDGWRYALLPADAEACRAALSTLDAAAAATAGQAFHRLDAAGQDALLERVAAAQCTDGALNGRQMQLWFEDLRGDAVRLYVAHPATLARIGYSGIANGGDGPHKSGFVQLGAGQREDWEPVATTGIPA